MPKRKTLKQQVEELQQQIDDHKHDLEVYGVLANSLRAIANTLPHDSEKRSRALIIAQTLDEVAAGDIFDVDDRLKAEI